MKCLPNLARGAAALLVLLLASCENISPQAQSWNSRLPQTAGLGQVTPAQLYREIGVHVDLLPKGKVGRKGWAMNPRYITIHSTQNFSASANAFQHALALKRGALKARRRPGGNRTGYLTWHFTVQENAAVQRLPTREQGEHADFDGPGNNYSIGIEMCENRGNDLAWTVDRTARLAAYLMYVHRIPLSNIVPALSLAPPRHQPLARRLPALPAQQRQTRRDLALVPEPGAGALQPHCARAHDQRVRTDLGGFAVPALAAAFKRTAQHYHRPASPSSAVITANFLCFSDQA